jgi:gentisate 1,2-dioxygenase
MTAHPVETIFAPASVRTDMADMTVQRPEAPASEVEARARFFNSGNAFNQKLPPVPPTAFRDEARRALKAAVSGAAQLIDCDQSAAIGLDSPATTPLMLARYARLGSGDELSVCPQASGAIWYVIRGLGETNVGPDRFSWDAGDVFLTPGGQETRLTAGPDGAVLWLVTDEPLYALGPMIPAAPHPRSAAVHYPVGEIARQLQRVVEASQNATTSGVALIFSSSALEESRNILPTLTLSLNTVPPGEHQRAHQHNSAAVTLILNGEGAYSMVGGGRCDWSPHATLVTPAGDVHSHHNPSDERAMFLIVQDGGLHYHARTMGFRFVESPGPAA